MSGVAQHGLQAPGIVRRVATLVVIKVAIDRMPEGGPGGAGTGPAGQCLYRVAALVGCTGAVQTQVDKVGGALPRCQETVQFIDAECRGMP